MSDKPKRNPLLIASPIIAIIAIIALVQMLSGKGDVTGEEKPSTITVQQAEAALQKAFPKITVDSVKPSPIEGVWEMVAVTPQGKRLGYIDVEGKFLLSGSLIELATGTDLTRKRSEDLNRVDFASIPLGDAIVLGNPNATKKVVVFDDPD